MQKFKIDWLFIAGFTVMALLAFGLLAKPAHAGGSGVGIGIAGSLSNSQAGAQAISGTSTNSFNSSIPANTSARVENVPGLGGLMGWAYGAGSGNCIGPSDSTAVSAQAGWVGAGVGLGGGRANTNLDWGCVLRRELEVADSLCKGGMKQACDDRAALYEMQPGISAIRAKAMPEYANAQVVPKPAPAQQPRAAAPATQPVRTAAVQQPTNCVSDEFIARRTGAALCK